MKKDFIRYRSLLSFVAAAGVTALISSCAPKGSGTPGADSTATAGMPPSVERGKYIVTIAGCNDCHTPWKMGQQGPEPDMSRMLSGHPAAMPIGAAANLQPPWMAAGDMTMTAWSGPWGVSFTANLTPDSATGLGAWSLETFDSALRTGKHMGKGRPILPPMPWPGIKEMTDNDLASVYQYLRSIPAISNKVPDPIMPSTTMPPGMGGHAPGMGAPMPPGGIAPPNAPPAPPPPPPPPPPHGRKKK